MKAQKEVRSTVGKVYTALEKTNISISIYLYLYIINRMLIEILMLKVLLVRAQKDTRNMLLETRGKKVLIT